MTKISKKTSLTSEHLRTAVLAMPVFSLLTSGARMMLDYYTIECHPDDPHAALARARRISSVPKSDYLDLIDSVEQHAIRLAAA